jgi:Fe2+ or Zn2+ uptake regulation protein
MTSHEQDTDCYNIVSKDRLQELAKKYDKNMLCVYLILQQENRLSSKQIVQIALSQKYDELCTGCGSADNVFRALKKLQEQGIVISCLIKGGYHWQLIDGSN